MYTRKQTAGRQHTGAGQNWPGSQPTGSPHGGAQPKSSSSVHSEPSCWPKSAAGSAPSLSAHGGTGTDCATQGCKQRRTHRCPKPHRRRQLSPPRGSRRPPAPIWCAAGRPKLPRSTAVRVRRPPAALAPPRQVGVEQPLLAPRRQQQPRLTPPRPAISIVDSLISDWNPD